MPFCWYNKNMTCNCKDNCKCNHCGCGRPILDIEEMPDSVAMLKFNVNGVSSWYDYTNMIEQTQSDTILIADAIERILQYQAERHTDSITAAELGAILHIADLGDVDITNVEDNSLFVYQKNSNCGSGCIGINNKWVGWNALTNQTTSAQMAMTFDAAGKPHALSAPANADQFYQLGWNADKQLSYTQPVQFASADGKKQLYIDPNTKQIGFLA